jgi:hypothetical protein
MGSPTTAQHAGGHTYALKGALCVELPIEAAVRNVAVMATSATIVRTPRPEDIARCMCLTSFRIAVGRASGGSHIDHSRGAKRPLTEGR